MAANPRDIENRNYGVVPLTEGLDLSESKAVVTPGTLQDCLNYEVVSRGYTRSQGLMLYHGTYDHAIESLWYIADLDSNLILGGAGTFTLGGEVTWLGGSGTCVYWHTDGANSYKALGVVDIEGATPDNALTFTDTETGTALTIGREKQLLLDATYPHNSLPVAGNVMDYLSFINSVNTAIAAQSSSAWNKFKPRPAGIGGITGGFQFQDDVYVSRDYMGSGFKEGANEPVFEDIITIGGFTGMVSDVVLQAGSWEAGDAKGVIYFEPHDGGTNDDTIFRTLVTGTTITNTTAGNTVGVMDTSYNSNKSHLWKAYIDGWRLLDLGYGLRFKEGQNPPNAQVAPLFLPTVADATDSVLDTGAVFVDSASAVGDPITYSAFSNVTNVYANDGNTADTTISASGLSQLIEAAISAAISAEDTEIIGVEVAIEASQNTGVDAYVSSIRLVNDAADALQYSSDDLSDNQPLTTTPTEYTFGGQTELWGMESLTAKQFNDGDVKVQVQFGNSNGSSTRTVSVDYITVTVHYIARGQTLYFWDGSSDVSTGDVYSFEKHDGDWYDAAGPSGGDATGYMALHNVSAPAAVTAGLEIRSAASGGGTLIATTAGRLGRNLLPSEAELAAEESRWETIEANFYANDEGDGIYGATGADSAFMFDVNEKFAYIRAPVARRKDKPRHVAFHANHLVLGMISGHILVSATDQPNNFDIQDNAATFSFRDRCTGLVPLAGNALGIMCRESVHALIGTSSVTVVNDPFRTQNITPKTGAIEYTLADVSGPMYADYNGVSDLQTSDKFGDFDKGRLTERIEEWTRDRLQNRPSATTTERKAVAAVPVRAKNQYRIFFADGYILNVYVGGTTREKPICTTSHLEPATMSAKYVPTWIDSKVLTSGRERIVMGDAEGYVWIVDGANGIQNATGLQEVPCHVTINPINTGFPQGAHKTYAFQILGDFLGAQDITTQVGYDYLDVSSSARTKIIGSYAAAPLLEPVTDYTDVFVDSYTDGTSLKIATSMDGSKPHTMHTLVQRYSRKGSGRNNTGIPR